MPPRNQLNIRNHAETGTCISYMHVIANQLTNESVCGLDEG